MAYYMVFFYLTILLFSVFLQFKDNFARGQNSSKYRDWAPFVKSNRKIDQIKQGGEINMENRELPFVTKFQFPVEMSELR